MKVLINHTARKFCLLLMLISASISAFAQTARKEKDAVKIAEIKKLVETNTYIFKADFVYPLRGGSRQLTTEYDMNVVKDSVIAYLPYFGQAWIAPINPEDGGIKFTSTKFDYNVKKNKNGSWLVTIKPHDAKYVRQLYLNISQDGYATLNINSDDRDAISYQGYIEAKKQKG